MRKKSGILRKKKDLPYIHRDENGELARAVCFQESAEKGNADFIEGRLYRRFPSCFQKIKKVLAKDHNLMLQY